MIREAIRGPRLLMTGLCLVLLAGCGSTPPQNTGVRSSLPDPVSRTPTTGVGAQAASVALQQVGIPYRYGGSDRNGFDCSGLVQYAYQAAGKQLPRTTGQLWHATEVVDRTSLQNGDLLFFSIEGKMSHVGIYVGNGRFVHAPSSGRRVSVQDVDAPFYRAALLRAGRPY